MFHTKLALGLLTLALAAPFAHAQSAPPEPAKSTASAVDPGSIQALKNMGAHLQTLKRFNVMTDLTGEPDKQIAFSAIRWRKVVEQGDVVITQATGFDPPVGTAAGSGTRPARYSASTARHTSRGSSSFRFRAALMRAWYSHGRSVHIASW